MKKTFLFILATFVLVVGCQQKKDKTTTITVEDKKVVKTLAQKIEIAHQKDAFLKYEAISFDAAITFGGAEVFNANITITTSSDLAKITYNNGDEIYVNQQDVFVSPSLKDNPGVRFHAYTWSYFFLFPYKLNDKGTQWDYNFNTNETSTPFNTAKLSFEANIGDAPEDWYITYSDVNTNVLNHVAYIVTAGKTKEAAEADPHAIKYGQYQTINGIPFSTEWSFYEWNLKDGLTNKIGSGKISNIKFIDNFRSTNSIPKEYIKK